MSATEATIYISSRQNPDHQISIHHLSKSLDDDSLTFTNRGHLNESFSCSTQLAATHSGNLLFAVTDSPDQEQSRIYAWKLKDDNGSRLDAPEYLSSWPVGGECTRQVLIHPNDRFIYVTCYESGVASAYKDTGKRGELVLSNIFKFQGGSGVIPGEQDTAHISAVILTPGDEYVYFTDAGSDCVWRTNYSVMAGFEYITTLPEPYKAPDGSGPGPGVASKRSEGIFLYIGCTFSNLLVVYWVDEEESGALEQRQYLAVVPEEEVEAKEQPTSGVTDVKISEDEKSIYAASGVRNAISLFKIEDDGMVSFVRWVKSGGVGPVALILIPKWDVMIVANRDSKDLTAFKLEKDTGDLVKRLEINNGEKLELGFEPVSMSVLV